MALDLTALVMADVHQPLQGALLVRIALRVYALAMMWIGRYRIAVLVKDSHARTERPLLVAAADNHKQPPYAENGPAAKTLETLDPILLRAALTSFALAITSAMMASIFIVLR